MNIDQTCSARRFAAFLSIFGVAAAAWAAPSITRINLTDDGFEAARPPSSISAVSADGRFVAFQSEATNLVPGDTNGVTDVFVKDLQTGIIERVSVASDGTEATEKCGDNPPSISGDGRIVAFESPSRGLDPNKTTGTIDVFVHDRLTRQTTLISRHPSGDLSNKGAFYPSVSNDGRYVAFSSNSTNLVETPTVNGQIYLYDRTSGTMSLVSTGIDGQPANDHCYAAVLSGDGRAVAFVSTARNLVPDDTSTMEKVFVKDLQTGVTSLASMGYDGMPANWHSTYPAISGDGRVVAFVSAASNLVTNHTFYTLDVYVHNRDTRTTTIVTGSFDTSQPNFHSSAPALNADGTVVAFASQSSNLVEGDTNGVADIFVKDFRTGELQRFPTGLDGAEVKEACADPALSADGRLVVFHCAASNLTADDRNGVEDVFALDRASGAISRVSTGPNGRERGGGDSHNPAISADGSYIAYVTAAVNIAPQSMPWQWWVVLYDRAAGRTTPIAPGDFAAISGDGRYVAFASWVPDLMPGDTDIDHDVFLYDRETARIIALSAAPDGTPENATSWRPAVSADGRYVVFESSASNLLPGDTNNNAGIFLYDIAAARLSRVSTRPDGTPTSRGSESPAISADGRYVAFWSLDTGLVPGDTNDNWDVFVKDLQSGEITRTTLTSSGEQIVHMGFTDPPSLSADGRFVAFISGSVELAPERPHPWTQVYVHDRVTGRTECVSINDEGRTGNGNSEMPCLSSDGRFVTFISMASNLAEGDDYGQCDVFLHDRQTRRTVRISSAASGASGNNWSGAQMYLDGGRVGLYGAPISADGRLVTFIASASDLVPDDRNAATDVFVYGPIPSTVPPTLGDAARALRLAGGLAPMEDGDAWLDLHADGTGISLLDAILVAREAVATATAP